MRSGSSEVEPRALELLTALSALAAASIIVIAAREDQANRCTPAPDHGGVPKNVTADASDGGFADTPLDIPPKGWQEITVRVYREFLDDRVMAVAAGATFYALLALFPACVALVSLYGLTSDLATLTDQLHSLNGVLPHAALNFIGDQVTRIIEKSDKTLGYAFLFGLATAIWSANSGMKALFDALNVVYDEKEKRNFFLLNLTSLSFTLGAVLFLIVAFNAVVVLPIFLRFVWLENETEALLSFARWPLLFVSVLLGLTLLYRFGPSRRRAKWRWATTGSILAGVFWVGGSLAFSWYAENLAHFDKTYGSLGAAIGFMLWMWMSVIVVLVGGEFNAEMERQTVIDTTSGLPRPLGSRGAVVADTVARSDRLDMKLQASDGPQHGSL